MSSNPAEAEFDQTTIPDLARVRDSDRGYFACCRQYKARTQRLSWPLRADGRATTV